MASTTYIPRIVRANLAKGTQLPHLRGSAGSAPRSESTPIARSSGGGGSSDLTDELPEGARIYTGGGSGLLGLMGALGVFDRPGKGLSRRQMQDQAINDIAQTYQQLITRMSPQQALGEIIKQPGAAATLLLHPEVGRNLANLHQLLGNSQKPYGITKQGQVLVADENGNIVAKDIPGYKGEKAEEGAPTVTTLKGSQGQYDVIRLPNGKYQIGVPRKSQEVQESDVAAKNQQGAARVEQGAERIEQANQKLAQHQEEVNSRYKIEREDNKLLSAAPQVLGAMDILRDWAVDANGFITGPMGELAGRIFGTNAASIVWNNAKNVLAQSLMIGGIPSNYRGTMERFLKTLPDNWENARWNRTDLSMAARAFRADANARLANVEQMNGGRPYTEANLNGLRDVGIIPPSAGWDNPLALVKSGPQAMQNASDQQLEWLYQHRQMLNPTEAAIAKAEVMRRLTAQQQEQQGFRSQPATPAPVQPASPPQERQVPQAMPQPQEPPPQAQPRREQEQSSAPAPQQTPLPGGGAAAVIPPAPQPVPQPSSPPPSQTPQPQQRSEAPPQALEQVAQNYQQQMAAASAPNPQPAPGQIRPITPYDVVS